MYTNVELTEQKKNCTKKYTDVQTIYTHLYKLTDRKI